MAPLCALVRASGGDRGGEPVGVAQQRPGLGMPSPACSDLEPAVAAKRDQETRLMRFERALVVEHLHRVAAKSHIVLRDPLAYATRCRPAAYVPIGLISRRRRAVADTRLLRLAHQSCGRQGDYGAALAELVSGMIQFGHADAPSTGGDQADTA